MLVLLCHAAIAAEDRHNADPSEADKPRWFDIDRMPLRQALEGFFRTTGHSLLYDDALTSGKQTGPLKGEFTPEAALRTLLSGTGLVARRTAPSAWVLFDTASPRADDAENASSPPDNRQSSGPASASTRYYAALQSAVSSALCADPVTTPGPYRMALRLWIGSDNVIQKVLLHPTGDAVRDQHVQMRLKGLRLPVTMPAGVISPVTLVVLPRDPAESGDCAAPRASSPDAA